MVSVKQALLDAKSKLAFKIKQESDLWKLQRVAFRCYSSLYTMLPDPFSRVYVHIGGWVTRPDQQGCIWWSTGLCHIMSVNH